MHLGQCTAGLYLVRLDGDPRWATPCVSGASGHVVIRTDDDVIGMVVSMCQWHLTMYDRENMFTNM